MKNVKIRTRLTALVGFLLVFIVAIGYISLLFMRDINTVSTEITKKWLPATIAAEELNTAISNFRMQEYRHIVAGDSNEKSEIDADFSEQAAHIDSLFASYTPHGAQDAALLDGAKGVWSQYMDAHADIIGLSRDQKAEAAIGLMAGDASSRFTEVSDAVLELVDYNRSAIDKANARADITYEYGMKTMLGALAAVIAASLVCSFMIIHSIVKPVMEIDSVAREIAQGRLDAEIAYRSRDELGVLAANFNQTVARLRGYVHYIGEISDTLDAMASGKLTFRLKYDYMGEFAKIKASLIRISDSFNDTLGQIGVAADQVAGGSEQVAAGAQALSQGATEQASSVEELAATISEISRQVIGNAQSASEGARRMDELGGEIRESNRRMQDMTAAMSEISGSSGEIGKIIKSIQDIAFQTNILALNAAVEAARAGAAGKGFAVVADEVRNLANKSQEAAKNTTQLIDSSLRSVDNGTRIAGATAESLAAVVEGAAQAAAMMDKITAASSEQASAIAQVTQGIDQISSVVQTNSATAEESAASSEELSGQAQVLKRLVGRFEIKGAEPPAGAEGYGRAGRAPASAGDNGKY